MIPLWTLLKPRPETYELAIGNVLIRNARPTSLRPATPATNATLLSQDLEEDRPGDGVHPKRMKSPRRRINAQTHPLPQRIRSGSAGGGGVWECDKEYSIRLASAYKPSGM